MYDVMVFGNLLDSRNLQISVKCGFDTYNYLLLRSLNPAGIYNFSVDFTTNENNINRAVKKLRQVRKPQSVKTEYTENHCI